MIWITRNGRQRQTTQTCATDVTRCFLFQASPSRSREHLASDERRQHPHAWTVDRHARGKLMPPSFDHGDLFIFISYFVTLHTVLTNNASIPFPVDERLKTKYIYNRVSIFCDVLFIDGFFFHLRNRCRFVSLCCRWNIFLSVKKQKKTTTTTKKNKSSVSRLDLLASPSPLCRCSSLKDDVHGCNHRTGIIDPDGLDTSNTIMAYSRMDLPFWNPSAGKDRFWVTHRGRCYWHRYWNSICHNNACSGHGRMLMSGAPQLEHAEKKLNRVTTQGERSCRLHTNAS